MSLLVFINHYGSILIVISIMESFLLLLLIITIFLINFKLNKFIKNFNSILKG